jgi:hypothetical protein
MNICLTIEEPEELTQYTELLAALQSAQIPYGEDRDEASNEIILTFGDDQEQAVYDILDALGIGFDDDTDSDQDYDDDMDKGEQPTSKDTVSTPEVPMSSQDDTQAAIDKINQGMTAEAVLDQLIASE